MIPIRAMLKSMNASLPFSTADAIADVGCGPGPATSELLRIYGATIPQSAKLVASDFSNGMVEQIKQLQAKHSGNIDWDRLETHIWDVQNLDNVADGTFSHVMGSLVLFLVDEPRKALGEIYRVLHDDGLVASTSFQKVEWMELLEAASRTVRPDLAAGMKPFELPKNWSTTEAVSHELDTAGFKDIQAEYVDTWMSVDDPSVFLRYTVKNENRSMLKMVDGFSDEDIDRVCTEFERLVDELCPTPPKRLRGVAVVATGRKSG